MSTHLGLQMQDATTQACLTPRVAPSRQRKGELQIITMASGQANHRPVAITLKRRWPGVGMHVRTVTDASPNPRRDSSLAPSIRGPRRRRLALGSRRAAVIVPRVQSIIILGLPSIDDPLHLRDLRGVSKVAWLHAQCLRERSNG